MTPVPDIATQIRAIAFREYRTRSSIGASSYVWVALAPIAWIAVVIAAFEILDRRIPLSTDVLTFVLSGVVPYMVFRFTVTGVIRARSSYRHVIKHLRVDPRVVFLTVTLVELSNLLLLSVVLVTLNWAILGNAVGVDLPAFTAGLCLASLLGSSFASLAIALDGLRESFTRAIPVVLRPSFYLSAVFYIPEELPTGLSTLIAYNPLTHCVGIFREGLVESYTSIAASAGYVLIACALLVGGSWYRSERLVAA